MDSIIFIKVAIVAFIVAATVWDMTKPFELATTQLGKLGKVLLLLVVLSVIYYDLHLGILLLVAYIMMIIQLNSPIVAALPTKIPQTQSEAFDEENVPTIPPTACDNKKKVEMNNGILEYSLDPKVKPYEMFIKMMTSQEHLDKAAGGEPRSPYQGWQW